MIKKFFPNKSILKASKSNHTKWKVFQFMCTYLARICWVLLASCFIYNLVFQLISEKTLCSKDLTISLIDIFMNNFIYDSYKFTCKFAFIPFLSFRRVQKQEPNSQQVRGLVTRNISVLFVYSDSRYTSKACRIQYNFINNLFFNICLYCSSMVSQNSFIIIFERILCFSFMAFHFAWF